jgi:hypothetical protein
LISVQVLEVSDQVPLPPGVLVETGAQIFSKKIGGIGGLSGRRSGMAGDDAAAEAAGADNTKASVEIGDGVDHVLSP